VRAIPDSSALRTARYKYGTGERELGADCSTAENEGQLHPDFHV
jgi:hypothetical protein